MHQHIMWCDVFQAALRTRLWVYSGENTLRLDNGPLGEYSSIPLSPCNCAIRSSSSWSINRSTQSTKRTNSEWSILDGSPWGIGFTAQSGTSTSLEFSLVSIWKPCLAWGPHMAGGYCYGNSGPLIRVTILVLNGFCLYPQHLPVQTWLHSPNVAPGNPLNQSVKR